MILYIILGIILVINITTIILAVMSFKTSKNEYYSDDTIDFATIVYNNNRELNLLKLQAHSFKFVDKNLINKIFIFYQDSGKRDMKDVIAYYPEYLQDKVIVLYFDDMNLDKKYLKNGWKLQQYIKLYLANFIEKECYCILDAKNHFINNVDFSDFFQDNKPKLFTSQPGTMIQYYKNCLKYFNISCPFNYKYNKDGTQALGDEILVTTTPYIFIKKEIKNLINYIEKKEDQSFLSFFMKKDTITEFYLYSTYLIFSKKISNHSLVKAEKFAISIMHDPNVSWNTFENRNVKKEDSNTKVFGLHRKAPPQMPSEYKENLINMYKQFYDDKIIAFITENILK